MGKSIKAEMVPLVKQPVDVILAAARAAGRDAFITRAVIENHCDAVSMDWINSVMPSSLGVMDDDAFGELLGKAQAAFDEGVEQYLSNAEETAAGLGAEHKAACERAADTLYLASNAFLDIEQLLRILRGETEGCGTIDQRRVTSLVQIGIDLAHMRGELAGKDGDAFFAEANRV
ncbi:hypothetical protein AWB69_00004 [Caballeronia udeis]|uniref:Uncharacterized protein n=1 Tax=Caballeronia udeis TaxID=1232866 RepID=A0A158EP39_9BURK|nr:hypothetical protein [Caballeronia udeis]SAL09243.1 hypothetical protein AWB69_00004 [Caballeronia udeis]